VDIIQKPSTFHVEIDGENLDYGLELIDFETISCENGSKETVLTLKSTFKPIEIVVF